MFVIILFPLHSCPISVFSHNSSRVDRTKIESVKQKKKNILWKSRKAESDDPCLPEA